MVGQLLDRRYRIVEIIGSAEFGQTYIAKDTRRPGHPECFVKHMLPVTKEPKLLENARRLFDKEAEILERLGQHPQIPQLFAYFEENNQFYLVEEFIPGHTLASEILPGKPFSEDQVIKLLKELLEILVFVHGYGVIHRDIKPGNIIRRHPDGKLVLIDFGSVKEIGSQIAQGAMPPTMRIGTLEYMPIEQFQHNPQFNSDLYALGMIAIQALTGLPVYDLPKLRDPNNPNKGDMFWRHLTIVSQSFAEIIDKMVRYDYRMRYQSANEVLTDIHKITDLSNYRVPKLTLYRQEVERRASSRGEISIVGRKILDSMRMTLEIPGQQADAIEEEVLKPYREYRDKVQRYAQAVAEASKYERLLSPETREELKRLQQVLGLREEDAFKIEEKIAPTPVIYKVYQRLRNFIEIAPIAAMNQVAYAGHTGGTGSGARSRQRVAAKSSFSRRQFGWLNQNVLIGTGVVCCAGVLAILYGVVQSQAVQKQRALDTERLNTMKLLYSQTRYEECLSAGQEISDRSGFYTEVQQLLAQCTGGISWKNVYVKTLATHSDVVGAVAFSPDGKILASGSKDATVKLWDWASGNLLASFEGDSSPIWSIAFNPQGNRLAIATFYWRIMVWNLQTGESVRTVEHEAPVWAVAISPDSNTIASGSEDKTIKIWNSATGKLLYTLPEHSDYVYSVAFSPDGKTLVSGSKDKTIKIWEVASGTLLDTLEGHSDEVRSVAIAPDGKTVVSGSYDKTIKVWNLETGELIGNLQGHTGDIVSVAIAPDGKTIASASKDKTIKIWDLATGQLLNTLNGHTDEIYSVTFSPDGKMIASGSKDGTIKLWRR